MTPEQANLIRQAIGALKASLGGSMPELPLETQLEKPADLKGLKRKTQRLVVKLFDRYGYKPIDWDDREMRKIALDSGFINSDNFLATLEKRGIIKVNRGNNVRRFVKSFQFIVPVK